MDEERETRRTDRRLDSLYGVRQPPLGDFVLQMSDHPLGDTCVDERLVEDEDFGDASQVYSDGELPSLPDPDRPRSGDFGDVVQDGSLDGFDWDDFDRRMQQDRPAQPIEFCKFGGPRDVNF